MQEEEGRDWHFSCCLFSTYLPSDVDIQLHFMSMRGGHDFSYSLARTSQASTIWKSQLNKASFDCCWGGSRRDGESLYWWEEWCQWQAWSTVTARAGCQISIPFKIHRETECLNISVISRLMICDWGRRRLLWRLYIYLAKTYQTHSIVPHVFVYVLIHSK